jgi:hypothetical protein
VPPEPAQSLSSPDPDLSRIVRRTLVAAAVPDALTHEGRCGPKARCPNQTADDPYRLLELRHDAILAFCRCHRGRHDPPGATYDLLRAAFREALP